MKAAGPQPKPHSWVAWYCRPGNHIVHNPSSHVSTCMALQSWCLNRGKNPQDGLHQLDQNQCPDCYLGFKGKPACPTCGNTKEPPLDDNGRRIMYGRPPIPAAEFTAAMSANAPFEEQCFYELTLRTERYKIVDGQRVRYMHTETIKAKCLMVSGPMVMFHDYTGNRGTFKEHITSLMGGYRKIDDLPDKVWEIPEPVETCKCGHPVHEGQCKGTVGVERCQCGSLRGEVDRLRKQFNDLMSR